MDLMTFLSIRNVAFRFLAAVGCICLFQRLLSVQSSHCFQTVSVWSKFLAMFVLEGVLQPTWSLSFRDLLNVRFLDVFLLNNYHYLLSSVLLHIVSLFSLAFSSQGPSTGLVGELYHSNFISQKKKKTRTKANLI